ncbi:MAG TPA: hypothetical protein VIM65_03450 [Cyclobacteriaceae bacterium]
MIYRILIIAALSCVYSFISAQTTSPLTRTMRWNATGFTDQIAHVVATKPCQFVTYDTTKIEWIQKDGKIVYTLPVNNTSGEWSDPDTDGSIVYNVTLNDLTGSLTITRTGASIVLSLNLTGSSDSINNTYTISNFEIL